MAAVPAVGVTFAVVVVTAVVVVSMHSLRLSVPLAPSSSLRAVPQLVRQHKLELTFGFPSGEPGVFLEGIILRCFGPQPCGLAADTLLTFPRWP